MKQIKKVVFVAGTRTPFLKSGTHYQDMMSYQLGASAISGLLAKSGIKREDVDQVIMGTVIHNVRTPNVARESMLVAGLLDTTPAHTVSQACISANVAIAQASNMIKLGQADIIIAGGTDNTSDIPIGFPKKMRKKLFNARKIKSPLDSLKFLTSLRPSDFKPVTPNITEFTTGVTMGVDTDRLASRAGITRQEQDEFAVRSHNLAGEAQEKGFLESEISSTTSFPKNKIISKDNTFRADSTVEKISKLRPAFDKKNGTLTAANSSILTDGAAVVLLMSEEKALEMGLTPLATVEEYTFTARSPKDELLLGPAYSTPIILDAAGLSISDIGVFEYHEAFAAQLLANLKMLNSDKFAQEKLNKSKAIGEIPLDKLNIHGGSLALGHPFGATGARLMTTAVNRLHREDQEFAMLAACAAGGHGYLQIAPADHCRHLKTA